MPAGGPVWIKQSADCIPDRLIPPKRYVEASRQGGMPPTHFIRSCSTSYFPKSTTGGVDGAILSGRVDSKETASVTVLILLAIVWVVVLGSQLWKRRKERMSSHSVWAFKRQLKTLRRKHAELTPIDSFRHNPAGEASYFSAFQSTNVVAGDASWASHERVSLVRVIGPQAAQAAQTAGRMESGYSGSGGLAGYGGETGSSNYSYPSPASTYSTPASVIEAGSSVSSSSHNGDELYNDDDLLRDATPPYGNRSYRSYGGNESYNKSYNDDSMHDTPNYARNLHRSGSAALRRRRILVGLIGSAVVFFLFGLIPALGFMMILSMLGAAAAVAYIVLLAQLHTARHRSAGHNAARANTIRAHAERRHAAAGRISTASARRPAHARHLVVGERDGGKVYHDSDRYALPAGSDAYGEDDILNGRYANSSEPLPTRRVSGIR